MKKGFMSFLVLFLTACLTTEYKETTKENEQLYAFLINQDKLYVVGSRSDYEFSGDDVVALQAFLKSPLVNKINKVIVGNLYVYDNAEVTGAYTVEINAGQLTPKEKDTLLTQYQFKAENEKLQRVYAESGKQVKLANRQELLAKYAFNTPFETTIVRHKKERKLDQRAVGEGIVWAGVGVVMIPFAVVGSVFTLPAALVSKLAGE